MDLALPCQVGLERETNLPSYVNMFLLTAQARRRLKE